MHRTLRAAFLILSILLAYPPAHAIAGPAAITLAGPPSPPSPPSPHRTPRTGARAWPQDASDIAPDAGALFGELANGLRYVIYRNAEPPGRVSLRLHVDAGSLMENKDQRGLAHFLEHMVFNGTRHFPADELVPKMQRLGISFGAHANAYTSYDETVYMLDLPDLSEETLDLGFTVLRDFADGALIQPAEVEKERGVILAEKTSADSVEMRLLEKKYQHLLPGSLLTTRLPIGVEKVIRTAPAQRLKDFYANYYVPSRMTFVVVGDIDPAAMLTRITAGFASMVNPPKPGRDPAFGEIRQPKSVATAVFADSELSATSVSLMAVRNHVPTPDTVARRNAELPLELAHAMLNRRFERLAKAKDAAILAGQAEDSVEVNRVRFGSIEVMVANERWREAVGVLEQELRGAVEHGFSDAELTEIRANVLNDYEQAVQNKATRQSADIATEILTTLQAGEVFASPETEREIMTRALSTIDPGLCQSELKKYWEAGGTHLILTTKAAKTGSEKTLAGLYARSQRRKVKALEKVTNQAFSYEAFGPAGSVVSRKEIADLGITQLVLSNNVRVNLKQTPFEKNQISLLARVGSGQLLEPAPMLNTLASSLLQEGGLGRHSAEQLQVILAGRNVASVFGVDEDALHLAGTTTPADLSLQCQLMCAQLTDPGFRPEALWQFQKSVPVFYDGLKHSSQGGAAEMESWLHGGDARFTLPKMETLAAYDIAQVRQWLTPELQSGYLEVNVVGDFQPDTVMAPLLKTFGALAPRAPQRPALDERRVVAFPAAPANISFGFESKIPQAVSMVLWKTVGSREDPLQTRKLSLLAEILSDRLRKEIREKQGIAYSPGAASGGSEVLKDYGFLTAESICKPEEAAHLESAMQAVADQLAREGATADELERATKTTLTGFQERARTNGYWLHSVLARSQETDTPIALARSGESDCRSTSLEEINALARKYLTADKALLVAIKPKPAIKK